MGLLASFEKLIIEHGSASVRADQIALLRDEIAVFDRKLVDAEQRASLSEQRASLSEQRAVLAEQRTIELESKYQQANAKIRDLEQLIDERKQFVESHGAYFKKDGNGGFHDAVYCGSCRTPTSPEGTEAPGHRRFCCKCGWKSSFRLSGLREVRLTLP